MNLINAGIGSDASFIVQIDRDQQEQSAREKAREMGLGYVNLKSQSINLDALKLLSREDAEKFGAIIFDKIGKKLQVALYDPAQKEGISQNFAGFVCEFYLSSRIGIEEAMKTYDSDYFHKEKVKVREKIDEGQKALEAHLDDFKKLETTINTMPSESAVAEILLLSVAARASDIHFQPEKDGIILRIRIDGILHNMLKINKNPAKKIVLGIKYMAGMQSNISDIPQDGNIIKNINQRTVDLRVSTLPTTKGIESVVIRILDSSRGIKSFSELGLSTHVEKKVRRALSRKNGIVLVTGPTGSGKTTTLYSMLAELNSPERKLVTLEDPIEYHLTGVSQSQVNEDRNFNFETGFKSLLRHDPDVILVGEVRTLNTAKLAFEAALTGHTVMTSLHANSSVGAISRLRNMGVEDFNIAPTISAVFAQKLVRKLCPHCKISRDYDLKEFNLQDSVKRIQKVLPVTQIPFADAKQNSAKFFSAQGCTHCSQTGFAGQTAICEAFLITDEIREMILHKSSESEIRDHLFTKTDFLTLFQDGLLKVFAGEISLEELNRVAGF
jgi:type II secretory ATPase GspE/PulE/Tfp pilus assembly ATPase PilB-like protein